MRRGRTRLGVRLGNRDAAHQCPVVAAPAIEERGQGWRIRHLHRLSWGSPVFKGSPRQQEACHVGVARGRFSLATV
ncbi:hypothetical protein G6F31_021205 [Rhizopus arrhizus]|nr:hypothetical protein G6F31_021205 [Rhizopus arrhizus]KAG1367525.1 hypothetical protein G6F59_018773 [Rhizopus arrhizus]